MPSAVKLSDELLGSARREAQVTSRSMTQQVEYWARIGRAVERSAAIAPDRIRAALRAELEFDALGTDERMVVLGELERRVVRPRGDDALARRLREEGEALSRAGGDRDVLAREVEA